MLRPTTLSVVACIVLTTTAFSQMIWTKYVDPVLEPTPGSWDAATVIAHGFIRFQDTLKTWYMASASGTDYRIGYAWSIDGGITWTKHPFPVLTPTQSWEMNSVFAPNVIFTGSEFKMWYGGAFGAAGVISIGYARSNDGITWEKHSGNPVLKPGNFPAWDNILAGRPYVLGPDSTGLLKMWYHGHDGSSLRIGYAWSTDGGITWTKHPNPVLGVGPPGSWDDRNVGHPTVFFDGLTYQMWFHGNRDNPFLNSTSQIGYATSSDGTTWTKVDTPIVRRGPGSWESVAVFPGTVLFDGNMYHMWYTGDDGATMRIGYATSGPVTHLVDHHRNPPSIYRLSQNYPNPFNPATTIQFSILNTQFTILRVFDVVGREVATLVKGELAPGTYKVIWDAVDVASGVYFYRLTAGSFVETKRMILVR